MINQRWNNDFLEIMSVPEFFLPIVQREDSYDIRLKKLLDKYQEATEELLTSEEQATMEKICKNIQGAVDSYYQGIPSDAYLMFSEAMESLSHLNLSVMVKNNKIPYDEQLDLYRMVRSFKKNNEFYSRKDLFHMPYSLRNKVNSCRYSIAGFPSLYLGTNIDLCSCEIGNTSGYISKYKINRGTENTLIKVYDIAIKPKYFFDDDKKKEILDWTGVDISQKEIKYRYLFWYPLIASCSFVRSAKDKKENKFAPEYIIPQLFMQWVRKEASNQELFGIRYFSCNSIEDSEKGYNYVFPVSGKKQKKSDYCPVLKENFTLTNPIKVNLNNIEDYTQTTFDGEFKKIDDSGY